MHIRDFNLEIKALSAEGAFEGIAATFGPPADLGGDVIEPGAFAETLAGNPERPILWAHDPAEPIGTGRLREEAAGLMISGRLTLAVARAQEARALMMDNAVRGLSIGFLPRESKREGDTRRLTRIDLFEVSLVAVPMNPRARVTSVKDFARPASIRELEALLHDAGFSRREAKAIAARGWSGLSDAGDAEDELLEWLRQQTAAMRR
jgi:HK97 family phage prohead protease